MVGMPEAAHTDPLTDHVLKLSVVSCLGQFIYVQQTYVPEIVGRPDSRFWNAFFLYAPDALSIGARLVVLSFSVKCMTSVLFK